MSVAVASHNRFITQLFCFIFGFLILVNAVTQEAVRLEDGDDHALSVRRLPENNNYWKDYNKNQFDSNTQKDGNKNQYSYNNSNNSKNNKNSKDTNDDGNSKDENGDDEKDKNDSDAKENGQDNEAQKAPSQGGNDGVENSDIDDSLQPRPTQHPSPEPTRRPTKRPTPRPTERPTQRPTKRPTQSPTKHPSATPSISPSAAPSFSPSRSPSSSPSKSPSLSPSSSPSVAPSAVPSFSPTKSMYPSTSPSSAPTSAPSGAPSSAPTITRATVELTPFILFFDLEIPGSSTRTNFNLANDEERLLTRFIEYYLERWYSHKLQLNKHSINVVVDLSSTDITYTGRLLHDVMPTETLEQQRQRQASELTLVSVVVEMNWKKIYAGAVEFQHFADSWAVPAASGMDEFTEAAFHASVSTEFVNALVGYSNGNSGNQAGDKEDTSKRDGPLLSYVTHLKFYKITGQDGSTPGVDEGGGGLMSSHMAAIVAVWLTCAAFGMILSSVWCWMKFRSSHAKSIPVVKDSESGNSVRSSLGQKKVGDNDSERQLVPYHKDDMEESLAGFDVDTKSLASFPGKGTPSAVYDFDESDASTIAPPSAVSGVETSLRWSSRFEDVWNDDYPSR